MIILFKHRRCLASLVAERVSLLTHVHVAWPPCLQKVVRESWSAPAMGIDAHFCSRREDADSSPRPGVAKAEVRLMTCQSDR